MKQKNQKEPSCILVTKVIYYFCEVTASDWNFLGLMICDI